MAEPINDGECTPRDSIDALLADWARRRPDLDFGPVAVIARLGRARSHIDAELDAVFRELGLTPSNFEALVTLARIAGEGGVSQRRLADELGLTPGTVSVRIDRLVEQGLADRRPDPGSRRNALIALTAAGRALFERAAPTHLANERRLLAALSDAEQQLLADLLRKLLIEFEGSRPAEPGGDRLGLVVTPAHATMEMRAAVGLAPVAGLLVRSVEPGTAAARADLQPGDLLTHAGRRELRSIASLYAAVRETRGKGLRLRLLRGDERLEARLKLDPGSSIDAHRAAACEPGGHTHHIV